MIRATNFGAIIKRDSGGGGYVDLSDGRVFSAEQLDDAAARLASTLQQSGFERGDRFAILAANGAAFVIAYLGLMQGGFVPVPINFKLPAATIEDLVLDCNARGVFADAQRLALVPSGMQAFAIDDLAWLSAIVPADPVEPIGEEIAEILYTSGSSGRPKGVPLSHAGQLWALEKFAGNFQGEPERTIIVAPTYHMNGLFLTSVSLALGWFVVSMPQFSARAYLEQAALNRCTLLSGVPTMFALMARESDLIESLDLSSVKRVIVGSAPVTQSLLDDVALMFPCANTTISYGTTETGPAMFGAHPNGLPRPPLSIGAALPELEWRLVDGTAADNGVLHARTPAMFAGYLNLSEVTAKKLPDGWYNTGDVLRHDRNGFFFFVDRADDMFVCGGENIYPVEVEKLLEQHPDVHEAVVVPVDDVIKGAIPVAFVTARQKHDIDPLELRDFALRTGPAFSHPRAIVVKTAFPLGGTHKIDRRALMREAQALLAGRSELPR